MDLHKNWLILWVLLIAFCFFGFAVYCKHKKEMAYIENGYEQTVFPGTAIWRWQKIDNLSLQNNYVYMDSKGEIHNLP